MARNHLTLAIAGLLTIAYCGLFGLLILQIFQGRRLSRIEHSLDIIQDKTGRDIVDLVEENKVTIKATGTGITRVSLEACRKDNITHEIIMLIPTGTSFTSNSPERTSLVSTRGQQTSISFSDDCVLLTIPASSTDVKLPLPQAEDDLIVERNPRQAELQKIMSVLNELPEGLNEYQLDLVRQAVMWLFFNNPSYEQLGILKSFEWHSREIERVQAISSNQIINESLKKTDEESLTRLDRFRDDYLLNWTIPGQTIQIELNSSDFDPFLEIVNASNDKIIGYNDDGGENKGSKLSLSTEFGVDYIVRVTSYTKEGTGSYTLKLKTQSNTDSKRLLDEEKVTLALKVLDKAEIDITQKAIWQDRHYLEQNLQDEKLRKWLQVKFKKKQQ